MLIRLLEIRDVGGEQHIRLAQSGSGTMEPYAALSYCWGGEQHMTTDSKISTNIWFSCWFYSGQSSEDLFRLWGSRATSWPGLAFEGWYRLFKVGDIRFSWSRGGPVSWRAVWERPFGIVWMHVMQRLQKQLDWFDKRRRAGGFSRLDVLSSIYNIYHFTTMHFEASESSNRLAFKALPSSVTSFGRRSCKKGAATWFAGENSICRLSSYMWNIFRLHNLIISYNFKGAINFSQNCWAIRPSAFKFDFYSS